MNASYDKSTAVVVLPPVSHGRLQNRSLRAWLAQAQLTRNLQPGEMLARVCDELNLPYPQQGLAALRLWGQTSERPANWIAAADPVYLEPRLDHLCLHALLQTGVPSHEMRILIDHLQRLLSGDKQFGFMRLGTCSYLSSASPIDTAAVPPYVVDQQIPNSFLPQGESAATHRNLLSEIEMALHEHEVNILRESRGDQPINSLWLWGGGIAPKQETRPQPPLFSEDAQLTGYWYSATAVAEPWPGSINACIDHSVAGFVAEIPEYESDPALLESCLLELRAALRAGRLKRIVLLCRDGVRAEILRSQAWRFWRRDSALLAGGADE